MLLFYSQVLREGKRINKKVSTMRQRFNPELKRSHLFFMSFAAILLLLLPETAFAQPGRSRRPEDEKAFALVEFFTSEACLRCRATSALAADVVRFSGGPDSRVFLLSYHIDYLNSLTWRDPYSSEAYSRRQNEYMKKLRRGGAVPGSFVVNGTRLLETSSPVVMQRTVDAMKRKRSRADITLRAQPIEGERTLVIGYLIKGLGSIRRPFFELHVAALQPEIKRAIADGINEGEKFTHVNVVRSFATQRLEATGLKLVTGSVEVVLPVDLRHEDAQFVAFVQDPRTLEILGAEMLQTKEESTEP